MGVLCAAATLLALMNTLTEGSHCRMYNQTSSSYCGNMPMVTNSGSATRVSWSGLGFGVYSAYLEVRRVANIRGQLTGCLDAMEVDSRHVSRSSSYSLPSVDYNSLYIAKVIWLDSSNNAHYLNNSECYFIPQRTSPPPPIVSVRQVTARSVTLNLSSCTSSSTHGNLTYAVRYNTPTGQELIAVTSGSTLTIEHLLAGVDYTFTVTCNNTVGISVPVTTKSEDTLQPRISSVNVSKSLMFADISWDAPSAVDLVSGYEVQVVPHVGGTPQSPSVYLMASSSRYNISYRVMQSLMPETLYTFQVRANTSVGTSQWSIPVAVNTLPPVPNIVNGFSLVSSLSTMISLSWNGSNTSIDYYRLTLTSAEANTTETYDLFRTVNSHTFYNLISNTAYTVTIIAVNKVGVGPPVSVNVTTQGTEGGEGIYIVQPLAVTTGIFAFIVFIGVTGLLLTGGAWCTRRHATSKIQARCRKEDDCEIEDNVAYVTAHGDRVWSQNSFLHKREEVECEDDHKGYEGEGEETPELDYAPDLPSREYLKEKVKGPTEFASIPVYPDEESFHNESGWFESAPADVIAGKLGMDAAAFADLGSGVYFMCHRTKTQAKWVGLSPDLCRTLCGHLFQLYHKERSQLSPIEVELKFFSPLAADWDIQVWTAEPKELVLERAKKIVEFKTLKPRGLNTSLTLTGKEIWEEFISWFQAKRRNQK